MVKLPRSSVHQSPPRRSPPATFVALRLTSSPKQILQGPLCQRWSLPTRCPALRNHSPPVAWCSRPSDWLFHRAPRKNQPFLPVGLAMLLLGLRPKQTIQGSLRQRWSLPTSCPALKYRLGAADHYTSCVTMFMWFTLYCTIIIICLTQFLSDAVSLRLYPSFPTDIHNLKVHYGM